MTKAQWFDSMVSSETTPGRISLPPPPAPQWLDCAWPMESVTSDFATSLCSQTGVPPVVMPMKTYCSGSRGSFWKKGIPSRSMRARFSRPSLSSVSRSDMGNNLAVGTDDARLLDAVRLDGVQHRRQQLRGRRRAELVVDDDGEALVRPDHLGERGPRMRCLQRGRAGLGGVRDGRGLVREERRQQVGLGDGRG